MQEQGLLGSTSDDIAKWLFKGEMLNKRAIGDYLGEGLVTCFSFILLLFLETV